MDEGFVAVVYFCSGIDVLCGGLRRTQQEGHGVVEFGEERGVILQALVAAVKVQPDFGSRTCLEADGSIQLFVGGVGLLRYQSVRMEVFQAAEVVLHLTAFGLCVEGITVGKGYIGLSRRGQSVLSCQTRMPSRYVRRCALSSLRPEADNRD